MSGTRPQAARLVLKFGGELLENRSQLGNLARTIARIAERCPVVIVHGGGKEIDVALAAAGIAKQQVEGLRVTDERTLDVVVAVLAGSVNTRFVAALGAAGVPAVGLTGADARCGLSQPAPPHRTVDGTLVDLGRVGVPSADADMRLLRTLSDGGMVPVLACIGVTRDGQLLNINADTLAGAVAGRLGASRLIIAGATPGVLDERGATLRDLDSGGIGRLIAGRTATAGMIAKLRACEDALSHGAGEVVIVDGRDGSALEAAALGVPPPTATRILASVGT